MNQGNEQVTVPTPGRGLAFANLNPVAAFQRLREGSRCLPKIWILPPANFVQHVFGVLEVFNRFLR